MGSVVDTLQTLERVMEYKKAGADVCMAAARLAEEDARNVLVDMAVKHQDHVKRIPVLFKHLEFESAPSPEEMPLTEMRECLFHDVGKGSNLNLLGAAIRVEKEAMRLLRKPFERAGPGDLRDFLRLVIDTARKNVETLETLSSPPR